MYMFLKGYFFDMESEQLFVDFNRGILNTVILILIAVNNVILIIIINLY